MSNESPTTAPGVRWPLPRWTDFRTQALRLARLVNVAKALGESTWTYHEWNQEVRLSS